MRTLILSLLFATTLLPIPAWADVLQKIAESGTIRAGARKDSIPFGYVDQQGEWVGYSVDVLELIRQEVENVLEQPIELELVEVSPQDRFTAIQAGDIDIECGSTTFTWQRQKLVDFSVSYFASGTQLLVPTGSGLEDLNALAGAKIGVVPNTTNEEAIRNIQPAARLVAVKDRFDGWKKLQAGEIDGLASDGILLEGLRLAASDPSQYEVVPEYPYIYESYACSLPQNESAWRNLVNYSLVKFMQGIISDQPSTVEIFDQWFGENGVTPYSREIINDYFLGITDGFEWIPAGERY